MSTRSSSPSPLLSLFSRPVALSSLLIGVLASCAGGPTVAPTPDGPLTGCALMAGPTALCDGGKVLLDVAKADGPPAERIATIVRATPGDDSFFLEDGASTTSTDGAVTRVDTVHPTAVPTVVVGTVTFMAAKDGSVVVSCASFGDGDARCAARSAALLTTTVPAEASLQHKPAVTLPAVDGCHDTDAPYAVQRLCTGGEKLSVVGITGKFGPASSWWLFHRVVLSQATTVRALTTCPVLGELGPCAAVMTADRPALFGLTVERDELRITGCFYPAGATQIPAGCAPGFAPLPQPDTRRLLTKYDVTLNACALTQPADDGFNRSVVCESGDTIAQVDSAALAGVVTGKLAGAGAAAAKSVPCVVRGRASTCSKIENGGRSVWRADVDDAHVAAFVCGSAEAKPAQICAGFIDPAP